MGCCLSCARLSFKAQTRRCTQCACPSVCLSVDLSRLCVWQQVQRRFLLLFLLLAGSALNFVFYNFRHVARSFKVVVVVGAVVVALI